MRINFKKISAIVASALMTGMTMGVAAAANYPAPFVSGGVANVAIVYGTGEGVSSLDLVQAGNIQDSLEEYVTGGSVTVEGGESFTLEKSSDMFNFNEALNGVYTDLDDSEMDFLADGTYDDGDVDEDYTQKITLGTKTLSLFADTDYNDKEPTIGFKWSNNDNILDYDIEFDDGIAFEDLADTDFPLMGNEYYVLDVDLTANTSIVLLDSAEKNVLAYGDEMTVGDKTVSIEYISTTSVKFNIDGEITDKLEDHEYEELADGSYIVANEIMYDEKESGISKVEFSIGAGKIELLNGEDIEVNDEDVDGLVATIGGQGTSEITGINIAWNSDDETFLTQENAVAMPLFETISLVFGGLDLPDDPETIAFESGEEMVLSMGNYDLPLFHHAGTNGATSTLGEEDYVLVTAIANLTANLTSGATVNYSSFEDNWTGGMNLMEDNRFLITNLGDDLSDIDTWYYEVSNIDWDGADVVIELNDLIGSNDIDFDGLTDTEEQGDLSITIKQVNDTNAYLNFSVASGTISYNTVVSEKGLEITLPAKTAVQTNDLDTGVALTLTEADKDEDLGQGVQFTVTIKDTTNDKLHASTYNTTVSDEEESDDVYVGYVLSDLATKTTHDQTADEYELELEYYGEEVTAEVMVVAGASTISGGEATLGNILVKDTEVSSVATKNLIVVGGSCINSAAAALVGGTKCGASWTEATGVGSGQFLIKGYADSSLTSELALLVAGYDAEDTVKATTYLTNKEVDTSKALKGTSSTLVAVEIEDA